ncbi:uncharacterized protein LOC122070825 [Macadamia integrifolia]|uniref:uncharacterized protein LOC122070825 n=1 Tax=Macadamia integrifolia TaxID=60698 RepID=UPI001C4F7181|nr:uncharacterized protein LOC122070825 [Macadamia integrifolia]
MERSLEEEESGDELQKQLKHLEEDWNSLKQSNPGRLQVQHCWATPHSSVRSAAAASASILELLGDKSPRDLIYSLEQIRHLQEDESGGVWKVRNNDLVVEEILRDRRAAIESGKLKGRKLFDFDLDILQDGSIRDLDINNRWGSEDRCSGRSSVLIQGSEVRSMGSSSSSDTDEDDGGTHGLYHHSSSSSVSAMKVESDKVVTSLDEKRLIWKGGGGGRERAMVLMMFYLAIFVIIFVLGIISLKSFEGFGDQQSSFDNLIPT